MGVWGESMVGGVYLWVCVYVCVGREGIAMLAALKKCFQGLSSPHHVLVKEGTCVSRWAQVVSVYT